MGRGVARGDATVAERRHVAGPLVSYARLAAAPQRAALVATQRVAWADDGDAAVAATAPAAVAIATEVGPLAVATLVAAAAAELAAPRLAGAAAELGVVA